MVSWCLVVISLTAVERLVEWTIAVYVTVMLLSRIHMAARLKAPFVPQNDGPAGFIMSNREPGRYARPGSHEDGGGGGALEAGNFLSFL